MMRAISLFLVCIPWAVAQRLQRDETLMRMVTSSEMLDTIIERTITKQDSMHQRTQDMQFLARSVFKEMDEHGNLKKEMLIERLVYEKGDMQATRYLSMNSNGKDLNEKQMAKEIDDWEKHGKRRGTTKMPFDPRHQGEYEYSMNGHVMYGDMYVWSVGFKPKETGDGYIEGIAYVHPIDYHVMRIEASPAELPGVIKEMNMVYSYREEQGCWVPESFEFSMRLKVQFVLTFVHNTYALADQYSQFIMNSGLPDSLFTGDR